MKLKKTMASIAFLLLGLGGLHAQKTATSSDGTTAGDMRYWNGFNWIIVAETPNEGATLQMISGVPTWIGGTPPPIQVGDFRDGGVVFWVDGSGGGLVCAVSDQSSRIQWCNGSFTTGATATAVGTGQANTTSIIAIQGVTQTNYAAGLAKAYTGGGYTDWFLPSKDELNEMYVNKEIIEVTAIANGGRGFVYRNYWSSTENNFNLAWYQYFGNGFQGNYNGKVSIYYVRAVRAF